MLDLDDPIQRKFRKELSTGVVALVLLAVVAEAGEPLYGYQIAKRLETGGGLLGGKLSALYPVLRNLEAAGLLDSFVEPSASGPPRRYYRATDAGRAALIGWIGTWSEARDLVDGLLPDRSPERRSRAAADPGDPPDSPSADSSA